ncbi:MAG: hypothetical protein IT269_10285, partial [Saprospiraceae bacterium]|nr:hypothetical protein [Saprospiraceae bacterium]
THPMLALTWAVLLFMSLNPFAFGLKSTTDSKAFLLLFTVFSTTFLIPGIGVALMKPLGLIKSLQMHDKQERTGPYIITGVFYLWMFKNIFSSGNMPTLYAVCVLGATIGLFLSFFVNIFTKISAHAVGMGGLVAMLLLAAFSWPGAAVAIGDLQISTVVVLAAIIVIGGIVGVARLSLDAHTPPDLYRGYATGFIAVFLAQMLIG